jgi:hypothetical protein
VIIRIEITASDVLFMRDRLEMSNVYAGTMRTSIPFMARFRMTYVVKLKSARNRPDQQLIRYAMCAHGLVLAYIDSPVAVRFLRTHPYPATIGLYYTRPESLC